MLKKTIKFLDFNGAEREEDFYFNLTKAEVAELELSVNGGISEMLKRIIASKDTKQLANVFKDLICRSYGVKSLDGRKFVKNAEVLEEFTATEAYSELYMDLATNADAAQKFVNAVLPKDMGIEDKPAHPALNK